MENFNAATKHTYSVANQEHLEKHKAAHELASNEWAGFHQWARVDRKVKKGAKGCKIYIICEKKEKAKGGKEEKRKVVKSLYVFNKEHTETI